MRFDLFNKIDIKRALSPVSVSDNTVLQTEILDTQGANSIVLALLTGAIDDADATFTVLLEEGSESDMSDATSVSDDNLLGTEALASFQFDDDDKCFKLGYVGVKRYLRATITPANNASAALLGGLWILGHLDNGPSANPPA